MYALVCCQVKEYDTDTRESLRQELTQAAELLDQAARMAMAAMLQVGVLLADLNGCELTATGLSSY
jgi:hypothetical protein